MLSRSSAGNEALGDCAKGALVVSTAPKAIQLNSVLAPVAQPGHTQGTKFSTSITHAHCRLSRQNPVIALSPVASVQRSISMFMKNCVSTPNMQAQKKPNPIL